MKNETLKLLDPVALLKDFPERRLVLGQVGTIVEILGNGVYEVEFTNKSGETIVECAIKLNDLMLLHYELELA